MHRTDGGDNKAEAEDQNLGATHGLNQERTWQNAPGWLADDGEPTFVSTPREDATGFYVAASDEREQETKVGRISE